MAHSEFRRDRKMIKRFSFLALFAVPSLAFGQTVVPARANHTLPQYSGVTAANSNAGAPRSMLRTVAPSAGSYAALWPPGGIRRDTQIPSLYADGSAGTLEQIGRMADGSVQQSDVGATVAPLDSNQMMSAPVSGDGSASPITARASNVTPQGGAPASVIADNGYLHSLGSSVVSGGLIDLKKTRDIIANITRPVTLHLSSGESVPAAGNALAITDAQRNKIAVVADGQMLDAADEDTSGAAWNGGQLSKQFGDSVLALAFEPRHGIVRDRNYSDDAIFDYTSRRSPAPLSSDFYVLTANWHSPSQCSNPSNTNYNSYWCDQGNWGSLIHKNNIYSTSNTGLTDTYLDFTSTGFGYSSAYDVRDFSRLHAKGANWTWMHVGELDEEGGLSLGGYTLNGVHTDSGIQHYNQELDFTGIGLDNPSTSYNPFDSRRYLQWVNTWYNGDENWNASSQYHENGTIVVHNSADGKDYMYVNTIDGGVTGGVIPKFTFNEQDLVPDGSAKWVFQGLKKFQIGCLYCSGFDVAKAQSGIEAGTLLASYLTIYNAGLDLSQLQYSAPVHVFMRASANSFLDLTADGTQAGQNHHLLGYDNVSKALIYKVNDIPVVTIKDSGVILSSAPPQMPIMTRAQIRVYPSPVKGMEIYDSDDDAPAIYTGAGWKLMTLSALPTN